MACSAHRGTRNRYRYAAPDFATIVADAHLGRHRRQHSIAMSMRGTRCGAASADDVDDAGNELTDTDLENEDIGSGASRKGVVPAEAQRANVQNGTGGTASPQQVAERKNSTTRSSMALSRSITSRKSSWSTVVNDDSDEDAEHGSDVSQMADPMRARKIMEDASERATRRKKLLSTQSVPLQGRARPADLLPAGPRVTTGQSQDVVSSEPVRTYRVASYCTAQEFRMRSLARVLARRRGLVVEAFDGVLHAVERDSELDVFFFPYGAVVIWSMADESEDQAVLDSLKPFERNPLEEAESDTFGFQHGSPGGGVPRMREDVIVLDYDSGADPGNEEARQNEILERLAVSHALAQSVRLTTIEDSVQRTIASTRELPEEMARNGAISKSHKDISRFMGRLITDRHNVFLYADVLDTPDFFWENERFEPIYRVAERYLELRQRAEVLNRRVEVVRDLFELLSQELQYKHGTDLEMIVIGLIAFEILITLVKDGLEVLSVRRAGGRIDVLSAIGLVFVVTAVSFLVAALLIFIWKKLIGRVTRV
ncbi:Sporulation protein RMD1 [Porphyridium purpureum]|uniref:Sporulation protein RMD1 n=1 Tax=Porphyridium purpureum TaxID=35688 RepID=A0A5J4YX83_PORPP|nr:Sporulation protein RMD1 [Porphyridium purpureum]|eukprot:POR8476..scf209_3